MKSILDQIDSFMAEKVISDHGFRVDYFSFMQAGGIHYFVTLIGKDGHSLRDQFASLKEVSDWLTGKGFKIYEGHKS